MAPRDRLCVALDLSDSAAAAQLAQELSQVVGFVKIGLELFTAGGPAAVKSVSSAGLKIFLDLKFHDIPNTVAGAARAATRLGVAMFNVHATGGTEMIRSAVKASTEEAAALRAPRPLVLAVTVSTSINDSILVDELRMSGSVKKTVEHLAVLSKAAGADGVVASPQETPVVRAACGSDFLIVTPGVRPTWAAALGDQQRVTTPAEAIRLGADYIVVGRPILEAGDRIAACGRIIAEVAGKIADDRKYD